MRTAGRPGNVMIFGAIGRDEAEGGEGWLRAENYDVWAGANWESVLIKFLEIKKNKTAKVS